MLNRVLWRWTLVAALLAAGAPASQAAWTPILGYDPLAGGKIPVGSDSVAKNKILADKLDSTTVQPESFESFSRGGVPSTLFGGTALLTVDVLGQLKGSIEDTTGNGRFNTTPGDTSKNWWQSSATFSLDFGSAPIEAFGFYGTDFGDFAGGFSLELYSGLTLVHTIDVLAELTATGPTATDNPPENGPNDGSLSFVGFFDDTGQKYDRLKFVINQCESSPTCDGIDILGFDDMYFGKVSGSNPTPEPGTLALVAASLLGLAVARRRGR